MSPSPSSSSSSSSSLSFLVIELSFAILGVSASLLDVYSATKISKRNSSIRRTRAAGVRSLDPLCLFPSLLSPPPPCSPSVSPLSPPPEKIRDKITPRHPPLASTPLPLLARSLVRALVSRVARARVSISRRVERSGAGRRDAVALARSLSLSRYLCPGQADERWGSLVAFNPSLSR